jgi:hypothetical protein
MLKQSADAKSNALLWYLNYLPLIGSARGPGSDIFRKK